ncbi:ABC transporter permease [Paenibacillus sp. sptzw28]|uniref:ABC transporter permease n=1 Tax=Paenibacillus sp. sptzw28 TaxID=715179 RepID=UPI001C6F31E0|nr:ABC transporter permease [Paenibacillus sp. sptzw28]QYR22693.1 ABC transporter permease [Paenibacillus sp. sptzw28]
MVSTHLTHLGSKADAAGRWTAGGLFRRRVARFWREQWGVWRTALDWTVWLYILIPALWIGGGLYAGLWNSPPSWLTELPLWAGERISLIVVLIGRLRTFAEDADVLFLLQKKEWVRSLTLRGLGYTSVILAFMASIVYALLLPFLVAIHHLSAGSIIALWGYTVEWAIIGAIWRNLIDGRYRGWRKIVWKTAAAALLTVTYVVPGVVTGTGWDQLLLPIVVGAAAIAILTRMKLRARDTFDSDVQLEHRARLASTELLLTGVIARKPRVKLNRPMLLRESNRLFKSFDDKTILAETVLKTFVRRLSLLRVWLSFTGASIMAVSLSPAGLKLTIVFVFPILLAIWVQSHFRNVAGEAFVKQFTWSDQALKEASERARYWLVVPAVVLLSVTSGLQIYGIPGIVIAAPALAIWFVVNKFLSDIMMLSLRKERR